MTRNWIVGYDGSPSASHTVDWAVTQGRDRDIRVRLISAWEVPFLARLSGLRMASGVDHAGLEATAASHLDSEVSRIAELGVDVDGQAIEGDARSVLIGESPTADLIVVGQRGHDGVGPLHLGSVSRHCATHSEVPTIVVPDDCPTDRLGRMAVAFDGSDESRAALTWALRFAGAEVFIEVVRAFEVMNWLSPAATLERFQLEIDDAQAVFESAIAEIDPAGRCVTRFEVGDPREVLDTVAEEVDLLVLGNRGSGRLTSAILGSVASHMLHHARTATAVVPA